MTKEYGNISDISPNVAGILGGLFLARRFGAKNPKTFKNDQPTWAYRLINNTSRTMKACTRAALAHPLYHD